MTNNSPHRLIQSIQINDTYPFTSFRHPDIETHIMLTRNNKEELYQYLREMYPFGAPGQDVIQSCVQKMSCQFCLKFGHTCDPDVYPSACPNVPDDYIKNLNFISSIYGIEVQVLNYFLMTGLGTFSSYGIKETIPEWSWFQFEKQLKQMRCECCSQLYHNKEKCPRKISDIHLVSKL